MSKEKQVKLRGRAVWSEVLGIKGREELMAHLHAWGSERKQGYLCFSSFLGIIYIISVFLSSSHSLIPFSLSSDTNTLLNLSLSITNALLIVKCYGLFSIFIPLTHFCSRVPGWAKFQISVSFLMVLDQKLTFYQIICYLKNNWIIPLSFITARPQCTYCLEKSLNFCPTLSSLPSIWLVGSK